MATYRISQTPISMELLAKLSDATGSGKSKMAASKLLMNGSSGNVYGEKPEMENQR